MAMANRVSERIIYSASKLFSEQGYDRVSLRDIADDAGTTIGNLTYHYPQKDKLLEAILVDFQNKVYDSVVAATEMQLSTFEIFLKVVKLLHNAHEENPLYYRNVLELCKNSTAVAGNMRKLGEFLYGYLVDCFDKLVSEGMMRQEIRKGAYCLLAHAFIISYTLWEQKISIRILGQPNVNMEVILYSMIFPYLTPEGITQFHKFVPQSQAPDDSEACSW